MTFDYEKVTSNIGREEVGNEDSAVGRVICREESTFCVSLSFMTHGD